MNYLIALSMLSLIITSCGFSEEKFISYGYKIIPQYNELRYLDEYYLAENNENKYGVINESNEIIVPFIYDEIKKIPKQSQFVVKKDDLYAVINIQDEIIIPFLYSNILICENTNYLICKKDNLHGILEGSGKVLLDFNYDKIESLEYGFLMEQNNQIGFLDANLNTIIPPLYEEGKYLDSKMYAVRNEEGLWGILDENNQIVISFSYFAIGDYTEKGIIAIKGVDFSKASPGLMPPPFYGVINKDVVIIDFQYVDIMDVGFGYACSKNMNEGGKSVVRSGIISYDGKEELIPFKYTNIIYKNNILLGEVRSEDFTNIESIALLEKNKAKELPKGVIDLEDCSLGFIVTKKENHDFLDFKVGIINDNFEKVIPFIYDDIIELSEDYYIVSKNGKYGIVSSNNNIVLPFDFDKLLYSNKEEQQFLIVEQNQRWGILDLGVKV